MVFSVDCCRFGKYGEVGSLKCSIVLDGESLQLTINNLQSSVSFDFEFEKCKLVALSGWGLSEWGNKWGNDTNILFSPDTMNTESERQFSKFTDRPFMSYTRCFANRNWTRFWRKSNSFGLSRLDGNYDIPFLFPFTLATRGKYARRKDHRRRREKHRQFHCNGTSWCCHLHHSTWWTKDRTTHFFIGSNTNEITC